MKNLVRFRPIAGMLLTAGAFALSGCAQFSPVASTPISIARAQEEEGDGKAEDAGTPEQLEVAPTRLDITEQTRAKTKFTDYLFWWKRLDMFEPELPEIDGSETMVFGSDGTKKTKRAPKGTIAAELQGAHTYFQRKEYKKARKLFAKMADATRYPKNITEEARFFEAECLRLEGYLPDAADTYSDVMKKHPSSIYSEQCLRHMFEIANGWLDDTRAKMEESQQVLRGERWFVRPRFFSTERGKPFMDREGRAMETLMKVRLYDINGPLADKALYLMGSVMFYNENYPEADYYFSQLVEMHPNSTLAPKAVELGIIAKHLSTGGSDYDGRKSAEARKLVQAAFNNYPELNKKRDFLMKQLVNINLQQAEKDFKMGEFYRKKGKPASAYFMYQMVIRRYPGTPYAKEADLLSKQLRAKHAGDPNIHMPDEKPIERRDTGPAPRPELAPTPTRVN